MNKCKIINGKQCKPFKIQAFIKDMNNCKSMKGKQCKPI